MPAKTLCAAGAVVFFASCPLLAQESAAQRHELATNQLKRLAAEMSNRCLKDIRALDDWQKRRAGLRQELLDMLGLSPLPPCTPLKAQITGRLEREVYRVEKIVFQSSPGLYVTGNFYVPNGPAKALPTILYLCGHSPHPLGAKFQYQDRAADAPLLIYVKRAADSFYGSDVDELLPLFGRYTVLILNPRLTEQPPSPADYTDVERTAAWSGRTIAAMQVWDVLRAVEGAVSEEKLAGAAVSIYGKEEMGVVAMYAALFDTRINQVILNQPPASHWQGPALLNALRVTDIAEVAGALAPRRLVSLTKLPESFGHTRSIYRLERASGQFVQSGSLAEALEVWRHPSANDKP
jgi:hypothetical protein